MKKVLLAASLFVVLPLCAMQEEGKDNGGKTPPKKKRGFSFWRKKKDEDQKDEKVKNGTELQDMRGIEKRETGGVSDIPLIEPVQYDSEDGETKKLLHALYKQADQYGGVVNWQSGKISECVSTSKRIESDIKKNKTLRDQILQSNKALGESNKKLLTAINIIKAFQRKMLVTYMCAVFLALNVVVHLVM